MADLLGYMAGLLGMISVVPQLVKSYRTKSVDGISMIMLWLFLLTNVLYIAYGILLSLTPVIVTLSISSVIIIMQMILMVKYRPRNKLD